MCRVVYQVGIFSRYSVGISPVLPIPYRRKLGRYISVSKRGQWPPFSSKGGNGPLFEELHPLLEKRGEERGGIYKKGGMIPTEIPKIQQIWYQQNTNTKKTAGNTVVYNSRFYTTTNQKYTGTMEGGSYGTRDLTGKWGERHRIDFGAIALGGGWKMK